MTQYISDIIPFEDIQVKWIPGSRILITAPTGSGKSEFIKQILYDHCFKTGERILLLTNRNVLREQTKEDLKINEFDIIDVINYQALEFKISNKDDIDKLFDAYTYIVYDEVHYIFSDSVFNRSTDLLIEPIKQRYLNKIFIFLTATPQALLDYEQNYDFVYTIKEDYSYIDKVYFYTSEDVAESILQSIAPEEKALYFSSNAKNALELSQRFSDSSFYCSDNNRLSDFSNKKVLNQIVDSAQFMDRFLFTTKVLDNGVNIKDEQLKHIFIDIPDPISFIQCLGRKRILNIGDTINLYIKSYHDGNLKYILRGFQNSIKIAQERIELGYEEFLNKYRKQNFDTVVDNDLNINIAKLQNCHTQIKLINQMLFNNHKSINFNSYENYICKLLNYDINNVKNANLEFEKMSLDKLIEKYKGIQMFKDQIVRFKALMVDRIFTPKQTDLRWMSRDTVNDIIKDHHLNYCVHAIRERKRNENRDKTYWIIKDHIWEKDDEEESI